MKFEGFLGSFLTKAAQKPDQNFALFNGQPITFAAIDRQSAALASHFNARGLKRGDRAAVMMRNSELSLTVLFGLARATGSAIFWNIVNLAWSSATRMRRKRSANAVRKYQRMPSS